MPSRSLLSKGKHPPAVQEHFYKFTDAIASIGWLENPETGQEMGVADRMAASDGEMVPFGLPCECRGAVEDWLSRLMRHCASTLRDQLPSSWATRSTRTSRCRATSGSASTARSSS